MGNLADFPQGHLATLTVTQSAVVAGENLLTQPVCLPEIAHEWFQGRKGLGSLRYHEWFQERKGLNSLEDCEWFQ